MCHAGPTVMSGVKTLAWQLPALLRYVDGVKPPGQSMIPKKPAP